MKLLLDENLPHQLRHEIPDHACSTVAFMGWGGAENGTLLTLATSAGFEAILTKDTNLQYEQNLVALLIAIVVLCAVSNDMDDIRPLIPRLLVALHNLHPKQITHVR
jgi:predicted nuclease of predicted toxin-antitoxin system